MPYAIWKASYCGSFDEVAIALQSAFRELGMDVPISRQPDMGRTNIVLGPCILPKRPEPLPEKMILYNMEQITPGHGWVHPGYGYLGLLKRHTVWDYSPLNISRLREMGVADPVLCGVGYAPELTCIPPAAEEDIDVLFIGTLSSRRTLVLDELRAKGLRVEVVTERYGKERDALIARSKIILNLHKERAQIFEIVRVSYLLANTRFVVSETGADAALEAPFRHGVAFAPYDRLVETCVQYADAKQTAERRRIAGEGFRAFRARPQAPMLQNALAISAPQRPRIFVLIPNYRDPECPHTVRDLFAKASHPERIAVGICRQDDLKDNTPYDHPAQVREIRVDWRKSKGANWARAQAASLSQGEEYTLMIDAHMRFAPGWDETLLRTLERCPSAQSALTVFPPHYEPPDALTLSPGKVALLRVNMLGRPGEAQQVHLQDMWAEAATLPGPVRTPFIVGGCLFGPSRMFHDVPIDPHIFFHGVETSLAARLWTHGWDVYQPTEPLIWHYWPRDYGSSVEYKNPDNPAQRLSTRRVRHLLGVEACEDAAALQNLDDFGHGTARTLESFFAFAGVDLEARSVQPFAKEGRWGAPQQPRIFVGIAAYRDPELQHTVQEMFAHAAHPERIFAGICRQFDKTEDAHCFTVPYPRPGQVRVIEVEARESRGVCWARAQVQTLWQGEEYALQIDSHMRFEKGWDEALIAMHRSCPSPRAVLTTYPAAYTPPRTIPHRATYRLVAKQFDRDGIFTMNSRPIPQDPPPELPLPGAFVGACMLFGPGSMLQDVPYDPHVYFFGEEISLSARLWTHGYDIYHPQRPAVYHYWDRKQRKTHFDDHAHWPKQNQRSFARVRHLLGTQKSDDAEALRDLERYGLGTARSLAQYQAFSGVDFARRSISPAAYEGIFPPPAGGRSGGGRERPRAIMPPPRNVYVAPHPSGGGRNAPRKVLETPDVLVYDDFLPQDVYDRLFEFTSQTDYEYINVKGTVKRVWDIGNGFPLRSEKNIFYYADGAKKPDAKWVYPSKTPFDTFIEHANRLNPQAAHLVGAAGRDWQHFSVTAWLYPQNTGLSMHDDGSGVYSGAYVFFMNNEWKPHWGGMLIVLDHESNAAIKKRKQEVDAYKYHMQKWLHLTDHGDIAMENGLANCIMPKANRMVYIHPDAFHMVTQVTPAAGDHVRMSLAGFFHRGKKDEKVGEAAY